MNFGCSDVITVHNGVATITDWGKPFEGAIEDRIVTSIACSGAKDRTGISLTREQATAITKFVLDRFEKGKTALERIPKRQSNLDYTLLLTESRTFFILTRKELGRGITKIAYDALMVQLCEDHSVTISSKAEIRILPIHKITINNDKLFNNEIRCDDLAGEIGSNHVIGKSLYRLRYTVEFGKRRLMMIVEKMDHDLSKVCAGDYRYTHQELLKIVIGTAGGLVDIHAKNLIHRDIKEENVFAFGGEGIIGDLGFCVTSTEVPEQYSGTADYMALEVVKETTVEKCREAQSQAQDLWAFGVMLYKFFHPMHFDPPFLLGHLTLFDTAKAITNVPEVPTMRDLFADWQAKTDLEKGVQSLIRALFTKNPAYRPTAEQTFERLKKLNQKLFGCC